MSRRIAAGRGPDAGPGIAAAAGLIAVVTLAARVVGFVRWLQFSRSVGATCVGTVYQAANSLPNVLFEVAAGGALAAVAVPLVAGAVGRGRLADADRTGSALLTWTVTLLLPATVLLALLAGPIGGWLVDERACPGGGDLAAYMLRLFAPQVVLYGIGIVLGGVLQAHRRFLAAALAPLLSSLVVLLSYAAYGRLAEGARSIDEVPTAATLALAGGTTLGVAVLSLPLIVPLWRSGVRLHPTMHFPEGAAGRVRSLAAAGLLALLAQQYALLATIVVANRSRTGVLNVFTYVQTVYLLPYAVLALPLAISTFPALAAMEGPAAAAHRGPSTREGRGGAAGPVLSRSLRAVVILGAAGGGVLAAVARPLGELFADLDAARTSNAGREVLGAMPDAVLAFAPGLPALGVAALLTRALYVRGRPLLAGSAVAAGWLIAGSVPLALVPPGSSPARALTVLGVASSIGMTVAALDLVAATARSWGTEALSGLRRTTLVAAGSALLAAACGIFLTGVWTVDGLLPAALQAVVVALGAAALQAALVAVGDRETARSTLARLRRRP